MMAFWSSKSGINSKYSFSSSPTFTAEPWSVYTGRPKGSSNASNLSKVSLFTFEKKQFENYLLSYGIIKSKSSSHDKKLIQEGYDILRDHVNNLAKLKHPYVLTLVEPLEEHSKNFMFVTEYVTGSLESIFSSDDTEEQDFLKGYIKDDIVIQRGILQLVNALDFIHNRASSVHLNIQPKSIFINENSDWKVSGLGHLFKLPQGTNTADYYFSQYDPRTPKFMSLDLDYTAPELVFENTVSCKNDYFSLGLLINFLYNGKNILFKTENSINQYKDEYSKFERKISSMTWDNVFIKVPDKLKSCISKLMNRDIYSRYDNIAEFANSEFFHDPLIKVLNFLDDLPTKSNEEKLVFLDGLVELLPQFPTSILQKKFLPILLELLDILCNEKTIDARCIVKDLDIVIKIGSNLSQLTFSEKILQILSHNNNFQVLLENATECLVDNLKILKDKVKSSEFLDKIMNPLLTYTLQDNTKENVVTVQEKILAQINLIIDCYDFPAIKNFLLPLFCKLFTKTTSLTIKIALVECFEKLISQNAVDKYTCTEDILQLFKTMKTRDSRILMKSLKLFEIVPKLVTDEESLIDQLVPLLWSYSMASTLTKSEYLEFVKIINKLSSDIQKNHITKLTDIARNSNNSGAINFNKVLESNEIKNPDDPDVVASKNISAPVMHPIKKEITDKRLTNTNNLSSKSRASSAILLPRTNNKPLSSPPGFSDRINVKRESPVQKNYYKSDMDDFDRFVTATPSHTPTLKPQPYTSSSSASSTTPPSASTSGIAQSSLPPGFFATPLQPSRKDQHSSSTYGTSGTNPLS